MSKTAAIDRVARQGVLRPRGFLVSRAPRCLAPARLARWRTRHHSRRGCGRGPYYRLRSFALPTLSREQLPTSPCLCPRRAGNPSPCLPRAGNLWPCLQGPYLLLAPPAPFYLHPPSARLLVVLAEGCRRGLLPPPVILPIAARRVDSLHLAGARR